MLNQLKSPEKDYDKGYYLTNFGYFQKKNLIITDLFSQRDSIRYKKAKNMLDSYVMKGQSRIHPK